MSLNGKVALVTGSTSGIGLGIARALAAEGAAIVLNGFGDAAAIEQIRTQIAAEHGVRVIYDGADVSNAAAIDSDGRADPVRTGQPGYPGQQCRHPTRGADR